MLYLKTGSRRTYFDYSDKRKCKRPQGILSEDWYPCHESLAPHKIRKVLTVRILMMYEQYSWHLLAVFWRTFALQERTPNWERRKFLLSPHPNTSYDLLTETEADWAECQEFLFCAIENVAEILFNFVVNNNAAYRRWPAVADSKISCTPGTCFL